MRRTRSPAGHLAHTSPDAALTPLPVTSCHFLSGGGVLGVPGELPQEAVLEVLVGHLRNQQLQQEVQDAEDQMPEGTQRTRLTCTCGWAGPGAEPR